MPKKFTNVEKLALVLHECMCQRNGSEGCDWYWGVQILFGENDSHGKEYFQMAERLVKFEGSYEKAIELLKALYGNEVVSKKLAKLRK